MGEFFYQLLLEAWCVSYGLMYSEKFWALIVASVFAAVSLNLWLRAVAKQ